MPNSEQRTDKLQLLSFTLDREVYAIDVMKIQGVERYTEITAIPKMPPFVEGMIDLRGQIVPVIDMKKRFSLSPIEPDNSTRIIITEMNKKLTGLLVDSVAEVFQIERREIGDIPPVGGYKLNLEFLVGVVRHNEGLVMIIDLEKVFTFEEKEHLTEMSGKQLDTLPDK
ncbi:MAG: chemotaxis protein CheW [bacterium]